MKETVGFIGLGKMGGQMAWRVAQGGYPIVVYDVRPDTVKRLVDNGAKAASSPKDVASQCKLILLSLPDSPIVEQVILGKNGIAEGAAKGTLIVDLSSAHPESTIKIGKELTEKGIDFIDAPVSGGAHGAAAGTLSIMVGGKKDLMEKAKPVLMTFGKTFFHCGPLGSGDTIKAANNFLSAMCFIGTGEAMILAAKAGLDPQTALDVILASSGSSNAGKGRFRELVMKGDFEPAKSMSLRLFHKDLSTAMDLATKSGVPMFLGAITQQLLAHAIAKLGPDAPSSAHIQLMEEAVGVKIRNRDVLDKEGR